MFAWEAERNGGGKGVSVGHNTLTSSLGGGEREVKEGEQCSPPNVPAGSPTQWVSPRVILHYPSAPMPT
jgi:hypothetical protein